MTTGIFAVMSSWSDR